MASSVDEAAPSRSGPGRLLGKLRWVVSKLQLDRTTVGTMAKAALAPTIALGAYLADDWRVQYGTTGYLVAIVCVLSSPMLPRARFWQSTLVLLQCTALAIAGNLLAIVCCVKARSTSAGLPVQSYDSSAAAVAGVFVFIQIWLFNYFRALYPIYTAPSIIISIFANVAMGYAPQFATIDAGVTYVLKLSAAVLTGLAIAVGVNTLVFPTNMRGVVFSGVVTYVSTLRKVMQANMTYIASLEKGDMFSRTPTGDTEHPRVVEAQTVKDLTTQLLAIHAKMGVDLTLAKREVAWGRLGPDDLQAIFRQLRVIMFIVVGFSSLNDLFERTTEQQGWTGLDSSKKFSDIQDEDEKHHAQSVEEWHHISSMLQGPFRHITGHIDDALAHILITFQLLSTREAAPDVEASSAASPGASQFTAHFGKCVQEFRDKKHFILRQFCEARGIALPAEFLDNRSSSYGKVPEWHSAFPQMNARSRYRRQLYTILFFDNLLEIIATRVYEFCVYADGRAASGKLKRGHLIVPGYKRIKKTLRQYLSRSSDRNQASFVNEDGHRPNNIYMGAAYHSRRDPEHLPPATTIEKLGDYLRAIPHALRSPESTFGLRVALATMCIAVIGLLAETHYFYIENRLFWAQLMVSISMAPSAGQALFGFGLRMIGTFTATCTSLIIWYIVDGRPPGVIVLYWFTMLWGFYFMLKHPRLIQVGMIFCITNTLIIGYGLESSLLGTVAVAANGQRYYPTYLLAPYRLATVAAGITVAWIWTMFPWPIAEHSGLRRDLGSALYLLANFNSIMDETVRARIRGDAEDPDPDSPFQKLAKARNKVYAKSSLTLQALRTHLLFVKYDVPIGGRFPAALYSKIAERVQNIFNFTALMVHASQAFEEMYHREALQRRDPEFVDGNDSNWLADLRKLIDEAEISSKECTTLLCLLSASVTSGNPLPPYLQAPQAFALAARLDALDRNILSIRHIAEPGFAAFACIQIGTKCIEDDIRALLRDIKILVGEMDFSFHIVSVRDDKSDDSLTEPGDEDWGGKGKGKSE